MQRMGLGLICVLECLLASWLALGACWLCIWWAGPRVVWEICTRKG